MKKLHLSAAIAMMFYAGNVSAETPLTPWQEYVSSQATEDNGSGGYTSGNTPEAYKAWLKINSLDNIDSYVNGNGRKVVIDHHPDGTRTQTEYNSDGSVSGVTLYDRYGQDSFRGSSVDAISGSFYYKTDPETNITTQIECTSGICDENSTHIYNIKTYNADGILQSYMPMSCDDEGCTPTSKEVFHYENGFLSSKDTYNSATSIESGEPDSTANYTGQYIVNQEYANGRPVTYAKTSFFMHQDGGKYELRSEENGRVKSLSDVTLDKYGNVLSYQYNGRFVRRETKYNEDYLHNQWLANRKLIYTVDEANQATGKVNSFKIMYR